MKEKVKKYVFKILSVDLIRILVVAMISSFSGLIFYNLCHLLLRLIR